MYEWIGSNYESIKTKEGLIIETQGLESDIEFFSTDFSLFNKAAFKTQVNLYNPDLIFTDITFEPIKSVMKGASIDQDLKMLTLEYKRIFPNIGMSSKDIYIYEDSIIFYTKQKINPLKEPLEIFFYFQ